MFLEFVRFLVGLRKKMLQITFISLFLDINPDKFLFFLENISDYFLNHYSRIENCSYVYLPRLFPSVLQSAGHTLI